MTHDELNRYVAGVEVTCRQYCDLERYLAELLRWNKKINLTSITRLDECWEKHIVDSLLAAPMIVAGERILDVGSGAGLPSIPLAIMYPECHFCSVDTVGKKINFQRHCARLLGLKNFDAVSCRIEQHTPQEGGYDVVMSRAFSSLHTFVQLTSNLINPSGRLLALKGSNYQQEVEEALPLLEQEGLVIDRVVEATLHPSGVLRAFVVIRRKNVN